MDVFNLISWVFQLYLAYFFFRSAYRKVTGYERVKAEFQGWGYPFPDYVTFFLIAVWILGATAILAPFLSGLAAAVLLGFMIVAFATLLIHGEYMRLVEPAIPIVLLAYVIAAQRKQVFSLVDLCWN
ncbi:MAG: DoxX family membrane protein [Hyphomicrobiales bacterium]|nr:DoxX family membrane protein [Hyphomicrobiales bacterium]